jgi:hypothetical protein
MAAKWTVRKRDGVWQAFDWEGKVRFASESWQRVVTFALLGYYEETEAQRIRRVIESWPRWPRLW